jgi:hypothetical protein
MAEQRKKGEKPRHLKRCYASLSIFTAKVFYSSSSPPRSTFTASKKFFPMKNAELFYTLMLSKFAKKPKNLASFVFVKIFKKYFYGIFFLGHPTPFFRFLSPFPLWVILKKIVGLCDLLMREGVKERESNAATLIKNVVESIWLEILFE